MRTAHSAGATPPTGARGLGTVLEFLSVLWALDHELTSRSKLMKLRHGITGPQRLVIRLVGRFPGICAGDLAELLHLHPSSLTGVLKKLEQRGLLKRTSDREDRRRAVLQLTALGRRKDQLRSGTVESVLRAALVKIDPEQIGAAREVLRSLARSLESSDTLGAPRRRRP